MAEAIAAAAFLASVVAVVLSYLSHREAKTANGLAVASNTIAEKAVAGAVRSEDLAAESNVIAQTAAAEAHRSAEAAHGSLKLQQDEAAAAADRRAQAQLAEVRPLRWHNSDRGTTTRAGLQVQNFGPAIARDLRVYYRLYPSSYFMAEIGVLAAGDTIGVQNGSEWVPPWLDGIPVPAPEQVAARVVWRNANGSKTVGDWMIVSM